MPLPDDLIDRCHSVVHDDQVFIYVSSAKNGAYLIRSSDLVNWQRLETPTQARFCNGMVSLGKSLYFIPSSPGSQPTVIYRLTASHRRSSKATPWIQLPEACPSIMNVPAWAGWAGVGHRIIAAGGQGVNGSMATTMEYDLESQCWHNSGLPSLPEPAQQQEAVVLDDHLHLLGGQYVGQNGHVSGIQSALSMEIGTRRSSGEWQKVLPTPPHVTCGACRIFDTVAVAGGGTKLAGYSSDVRVLDQDRKTWLRLPSLKTARNQSSLVVFKHTLLAVGGVNKYVGTVPAGWLSTVEQLKLAPSQ